MLCEVKQWWVFLVPALVAHLQHWVQGYPQVPCFFIFGDSLADNGNNNNLTTLAKADYSPYGVDYPSWQSGRFSNGLTTVDFLAEHLGFNHDIPSFASVENDPIILQGVNYESGSSGIRDETGRHLGIRINLRRQIKNHQITVRHITDFLGNGDSSRCHLNKCLYYVGIGSNDYLNNYFLPQYYSTSIHYSMEEFARLLVRQYYKRLMRLYRYGARKIALVGIGQIGCIPRAIDKYRTDKDRVCADNVNKASRLFNEKLKLLVDRFNTNLPGARLVYINSYGMGDGDPSVLGFKVTKSGCCEVREDGQCLPNGSYCDNRKDYLFFDSFHSTEALNKLIAARMYRAVDPSDSYPFDIYHLIRYGID